MKMNGSKILSKSIGIWDNFGFTNNNILLFSSRPLRTNSGKIVEGYCWLEVPQFSYKWGPEPSFKPFHQKCEAFSYVFLRPYGPSVISDVSIYSTKWFMWCYGSPCIDYDLPFWWINSEIIWCGWCLRKRSSCIPDWYFYLIVDIFSTTIRFWKKSFLP